MATHSSILAWRIPWREEPGGLQSMGHKESYMTEATHARGLLLSEGPVTVIRIILTYCCSRHLARKLSKILVQQFFFNLSSLIL